MGEETDFIRRLHPHGLFAGYYPKAVVYHVPSPSRMTISYLSRWYFRRGEWEWYATKCDPLPAGAVVWFGAPRWIYGSVLKMTLRVLFHIVRFQFQRAVFFHMQVCFYAGCLIAFVKPLHRRLAQPLAGAEVS